MHDTLDLMSLENDLKKDERRISRAETSLSLNDISLFDSRLDIGMRDKNFSIFSSISINTAVEHGNGKEELRKDSGLALPAGPIEVLNFDNVLMEASRNGVRRMRR